MSAPCTACGHDQQQEINAALVAGIGLRKLAARYGMSHMALARHKKHLSPALVPITIPGDVTPPAAGDALAEVRDLVREAKAVLAAAKANSNAQQQIAAINSSRALLELAARLTGELDTRPVTVINIQQTAEWVPVREVVYEILARHPEDLAELDERLKLLEVAT